MFSPKMLLWKISLENSCNGALFVTKVSSFSREHTSKVTLVDKVTVSATKTTH